MKGQNRRSLTTELPQPVGYRPEQPCIVPPPGGAARGVSAAITRLMSTKTGRRNDTGMKAEQGTAGIISGDSG